MISADSRKSAATAEIGRRQSGKIAGDRRLARRDRPHPPPAPPLVRVFRDGFHLLRREGGAGTRATSHAERITKSVIRPGATVAGAGSQRLERSGGSEKRTPTEPLGAAASCATEPQASGARGDQPRARDRTKLCRCGGRTPQQKEHRMARASGVRADRQRNAPWKDERPTPRAGSGMRGRPARPRSGEALASPQRGPRGSREGASIRRRSTAEAPKTTTARGCRRRHGRCRHPPCIAAGPTLGAAPRTARQGERAPPLPCHSWR